MAIFLGSSGNGILASRGAADLLAFLRDQATSRHAPAEADEESNLLSRLSHELDHEIAYEKATSVTFTAFLDSLDQAAYADELAAAYRRCVALCKEYFVHRQSVLAMHEMAGLAKDRLITAAALLAFKLLHLEDKHTPTARFAILTAGSSGRQEQTLRSNGSFFLIFDDSDGADREYFNRLKFQILALLRECGCTVAPDLHAPGDYVWTGTLAVWQEFIAQADRGPLPDRRPSIHLPGFFHTTDDETAPHLLEQLVDLRIVAGDPALLASGMALTAARIAGCWQMSTGRALARRATALPLAVGMFGGYRVERGGEHRGYFNLDQLAITPLITAVRWLSFATGMAGTGTMARIKGLQERGNLGIELTERLLHAYNDFISLKLFRQSTGNCDDGYACFIDPKDLTEDLEQRLKNGLQAVSALEKIAYLYFTERA
ncbi:putative nucleotidyltransferase substrate binding domain-containing protein [Geobacter argillaceus]|uniref:Putative nucleotidyltransferase DUF294 n=1 Tax=Geobacter argillaceus TaxID=345631 RepID=A0A562WSL8_9BACT|nr:putative nucleotidyltransferase substrate binding domain-containing protein [Geobacter argillaceus]TWJ33380.1 putative nucleotidyltransferase DUF294 [Geobacter argillaceus]